MSDWKYEAGEDRHKHHWRYDYAGFEYSGTQRIGKCPNTMTQEKAEKLLNDGIPVYNHKKNIGCPNEIFNVYNGAIYRAVPTLPGRSYHGFPEVNMPNDIENKLLKKAEKEGCKKEVVKWLKAHRKRKKR